MRLKIQLLILVLFAAVPVFVVQVYDELAQREQRHTDMENEVLRLARLAAAQQEQLIESLESVLVTAAELPQVRSRDGPACSAALTDLPVNFEELREIAAVAPDGTVFCRSLRTPQLMNIADRGFFQLALRSGHLAVSDYFPGRNSGLGMIAVAYPVRNAAGEIQTVMVLSLNVEQLSARLATMPLPRDAVVGLVDRNGAVIARDPYLPALIGDRGHSGKAMPLLAASREGNFLEIDPEGRERFYAFVRLASPVDFTAYVGLPRAGMFAEADRKFWQELALVALGFGLAALAALLAGDWWIGRPILALRRGVQRMRRGDLSGRVELSDMASQELGELAASFNAMAEALQAEQRALKAERTRLNAVLQQMPAGLMIAEAPSGKLILGNEQVQKIWRHPYRAVESIEDYPAYRAFHPDGRPYRPHEWPLARSLTSGETVIEEPIDILRGDDSPGTLSVSSVPLRDETGKVVGAVTAFHDITERKQADRHQHLLMAELDHRVKNTLAAVNSILAQTLRSSESPEAFSQAFRGRVQALARAHSLLTQSRWEGASLGDLIVNEFKPFGGLEGGQVRLRGDNLVLSNKAALALSMVMHELATNAAKYGALSVPQGQVAVSWTIDASPAAPHLRLCWEESGGPPVTAPSETGFGCTLISRSLSYELNGTADIEFAPTGLRCHLQIPLAELVRRHPIPMPAESAPESRAPGCSEAPGDLEGKRLLVVEDSLLVAMEIERMLRAQGCEVVGPATRVEQAVDLLTRESLDGALLDINIDGEKIYTVADLLTTRGIPFIFATGYDGETVLPAGYRSLPVLQKPFAQDELRRAMRDAFAGGPTARGVPGARARQ